MLGFLLLKGATQRYCNAITVLPVHSLGQAVAPELCNYMKILRVGDSPIVGMVKCVKGNEMQI